MLVLYRCLTVLICLLLGLLWYLGNYISLNFNSF
jgi:hypothetical protein